MYKTNGRISIVKTPSRLYTSMYYIYTYIYYYIILCCGIEELLRTHTLYIHCTNIRVYIYKSAKIKPRRTRLINRRARAVLGDIGTTTAIDGRLTARPSMVRDERLHIDSDSAPAEPET